MSNIAAIILTLSVLQMTEAAKILAWFPIPSISHQVVFRPLTQALARRGHEVTVVTPDPAFPKGQAPKNLTEIDIHDISYRVWIDTFMAKQNEMTDDMVTQIKMVYDTMTVTIDKQLSVPDVRRVIKEEGKYDLLLLENVIYAFALTHIIKAPMISIGSLGAAPGQFESMGAPSHPFLYPLFMSKRVYNLTTLEKLQELQTMWRMDRANENVFDNAWRMLSKHFGEDLPSLRELEKNMDLLMLNENPVWNGIRPIPPNIVYIGGIHQKPKKDLPDDLKKYLNSSKHGVIYISFGTNVDPTVLPSEKIQAFIKAFSELPYDVLWKWNEDELPGRTENIRISKWLPQSDLLCHPKVKVFITQGGLQSTNEAINAGVPVIGVPILGDQWYNVEHYVHHRVGLHLDIRTLDAEVVKNAVETVAGNPSYRENMLKIRDLMRDEPMSPLERAVWWTEHVLRHGGARHLRAPAADMPWTEYYELDLVLLVLGFALVLLLLATLTVSVAVRFVKNNFTNLKVKET